MFEVSRNPEPMSSTVAEKCSCLDAARSADARLCIEPPTLNVLVVEDDAADYALIERCLSYMPHYEPRIALAGTISAARFAAAHDRFDVILVDYSVGAEVGVDLLRDAARTSPCVLVTGKLSHEIQAEAMDAGAVTCLSKDDLTPGLLEAVLERIVAETERADGEQASGTPDRVLRMVGSAPVQMTGPPAAAPSGFLIEPSTVARAGLDQSQRIEANSIPCSRLTVDPASDTATGLLSKQRASHAEEGSTVCAAAIARQGRETGSVVTREETPKSTKRRRPDHKRVRSCRKQSG